MKIIQSYWSLPALGKEMAEGRQKGGWLSPRYHQMSMALSCLLLRRYYDEVELYTDQAGYELLIEKLQLPYTRVHVCLDSLNHYPYSLWALPKLYVYSLQQAPFLHIDGDVFVWERFSEDLLKAPLLVQNIEESFDFYQEAIRQMVADFDPLPGFFLDFVRSGAPPRAVNAGVLGGCDTAFIRDAAQQALTLIDQHLELFRQKPYTAGLNIILEQFFFYQLAVVQQKADQIATLFERVSKHFIEVVRFNEVPFRSRYIHTVGVYKNNPYTNQQIEFRLRFEFPAYYQKISWPEPGTPWNTGTKPSWELSLRALEILSPGTNPLFDEKSGAPLPDPALKKQLPAWKYRMLSQLLRLDKTAKRLPALPTEKKPALVCRSYELFNRIQPGDLLHIPLTLASHARIVALDWKPELLKPETLLADAPPPQARSYVLLRNENGYVQQIELIGWSHLLYYFQGQAVTGMQLLQAVEESAGAPVEDLPIQLEGFISVNLIYGANLRVVNKKIQ